MKGQIEKRGGGVYLRALVALLLVALFGCSTAKWARLPNDSPDVRRSKSIHRVITGIFTFGLIPMRLNKKAHQIAAAWKRYEAAAAATRTLAEARTLEALVQFLGGVPRCEVTGENQKACTWSFDTRVYGVSGAGFFGTYFGVWETTQVLRGGTLLVVNCIVPMDGGARVAGSCSHSTYVGMQQEGFLLVCRARHPIYCPPDAPYQYDELAPL